jgi:hypothetical protein
MLHPQAHYGDHASNLVTSQETSFSEKSTNHHIPPFLHE